MRAAAKPVAIITGVSGGIGTQTAKVFIERGWIVVGTVRGRRPTGPLKALGVDLQPAEMQRPGDLARVVERTVRTYRRLDAVVCLAGYGMVGPFDTYDYPQMREQLVVNTLAPAELARQAVPVMKRQGSGAIIFVSSLFGRVGAPWYSLYSASKFAIEGLAEGLELELAPAGVRVKLVEPAGVNSAWWSGLRRGAARKWRDSEMTGRLGAEHLRTGHGMQPESVAAAIFGAATDRSARLRYALGPAHWAVLASRLLPERIWRRLLKRSVM